MFKPGNRSEAMPYKVHAAGQDVVVRPTYRRATAARPEADYAVDSDWEPNEGRRVTHQELNSATSARALRIAGKTGWWALQLAFAAGVGAGLVHTAVDVLPLASDSHGLEMPTDAASIKHDLGVIPDGAQYTWHVWSGAAKLGIDAVKVIS